MTQTFMWTRTHARTLQRQTIEMKFNWNALCVSSSLNAARYYVIFYLFLFSPFFYAVFVIVQWWKVGGKARKMGTNSTSS